MSLKGLAQRLCSQLVTHAASVTCIGAGMQDDFDTDQKDFLILPLVAQQLYSAARALDTVNETKGLVRKQPQGRYFGCNRWSSKPRRPVKCRLSAGGLLIAFSVHARL